MGRGGEGAAACGVQVGAVKVPPRHHPGPRCPGRGAFHLRAAGHDLALDHHRGLGVAGAGVLVQGDDLRQLVP